MAVGHPMGVIAVAVDLVILYSVGAFSATASMEDGGLGAYSSNLNVFINPLGKGIFLPSLPHNPGQDEGYGYLGLGILILLDYPPYFGRGHLSFLFSALSKAEMIWGKKIPAAMAAISPAIHLRGMPSL